MSGILHYVSCFLCITILVRSILYYGTFPEEQGQSQIQTQTQTQAQEQEQEQEQQIQDPSQMGAFDPTVPPPVTLFYNVYVPPKFPEGIEIAYNIIEEQIGQVGESAIGNGRENVSVHYVTIGEPFNTTFMDDVCARHSLNCMHVKHYEEGFEMLTEQHILDYCNEEENESHIVSYMHNKGTLHMYDAQSRIRRTLTKSALSKECIEFFPDSQCNVCGSNFKSVWGPTYWGNMWTAKCSYAKNLVSPYDLEAQNRLAVETRPKEIKMNFYGTKAARGYALGEGRFAAEQFVSTHPDLVPCSFTKPEEAKGSFWVENPPGSFDSHVIQTEKPNMELMKDEQLRHREWFLLPGVLWRYYVLYNQLPPPESWVWRHYPDGEEWKEAIEKQGFPDALHNRIAVEM